MKMKRFLLIFLAHFQGYFSVWKFSLLQYQSKRLPKILVKQSLSFLVQPSTEVFDRPDSDKAKTMQVRFTPGPNWSFGTKITGYELAQSTWSILSKLILRVIWWQWLGNSMGFDLILMMTDTLTRSMIVSSSSISAFLTQLMIVGLNVILRNRKVTECCHSHQIKFSISVKCFQMEGVLRNLIFQHTRYLSSFLTPTHI